ncbi:MAG: phosphatase PAP2 family protein [Planctomycetota bacterium]
MLRTRVWILVVMLLAGCAGRSGDPFAAVDARLAALKCDARSGTPPAERARLCAETPAAWPTFSKVGDSNGLLFASPAAKALGHPPMAEEDESFDSFCLASYPTMEDSSVLSPTPRSLAARPVPQNVTVEPEKGESGDETAGSEISRRRTPLPGFWDTVQRDLRSMPEDLWQDTKAVYGSAPNLLILGLTYGGALTVQETGPDDTVEDGFRDHTIFSKDTRDVFGALGNPGTHFALAGAWYLLGQQRQNEKTYEVGRTLFSALIINGLSTLAGQAANWDRAPNGEWGTFPSGHTSSTFAVASVMHDAYGPLVGVPLYGLGVLVAMERLEDNEHYLSDVLMGGVMGLVIGHTVAGEHEFEFFGGKFLPYADPETGSSGVAWVKQFE